MILLVIFCFFIIFSASCGKKEEPAKNQTKTQSGMATEETAKPETAPGMVTEKAAKPETVPEQGVVEETTETGKDAAKTAGTEKKEAAEGMAKPETETTH
jgi:hypothetical protein